MRARRQTRGVQQEWLRRYNDACRDPELRSRRLDGAIDKLYGAGVAPKIAAALILQRYRLRNRWRLATFALLCCFVLAALASLLAWAVGLSPRDVPWMPPTFFVLQAALLGCAAVTVWLTYATVRPPQHETADTGA